MAVCQETVRTELNVCLFSEGIRVTIINSFTEITIFKICTSSDFKQYISFQKSIIL